MLKQPIYYEFNLDARTSPSKLIAISHVDDKYSEVLEVAVKQNDRFVYMGGVTVVARMVLHREKDYLLSDSVPCTVNANGNILIPFDNAVVKTSQGVVKIEVNITRSTDELTLQFPLWVSVNGSILDNAEVTPESKGTIPDLLKEAADALGDATEALEQLGDYDNLDNKPQIQINGQSSPLSGTLAFSPYDFFANVAGSITNIRLKNNVFESYLSPTSDVPYNFNLLSSQVQHTGVYRIRRADITNMPQEFSDIGQIIHIYHFMTNTTYSDLIRMVEYETTDGLKMWMQRANLGGDDASGNVQIANQTAWVDLTNQVGYALTPQDKTDIADIVLQELPTTQGVQYGN